MNLPNKYSIKEILLGLSLIKGIGQNTLRKLIDDSGTFDLSILNSSQLKSVKYFNWDELEELLDKLESKKIGYLSFKDELYPKSLLEIIDYPPILFYKGNSALFNNICFSIVGTRKITSYGKLCLDQFLPSLVEKQLVIVSGMAFGVDYYAQKSTLLNNGKTIAVLASGVDIPSPRSNVGLYKDILNKEGLIISELLPGTEPVAGFFPRRNRIISGLSKGVLIVEAGEKSGSLITAYSSFEQNREVFAIPGDLGKPSSQGTNQIIRDNVAKLVTCPEDILLELGFIKRKNDKKKNIEIQFDDDNERLVYNLLLENGSLTIDEISKKVSLSISFVSKILTMMELKGILTSVDSKYTVTL